jgi:hypothetical protein
MEALRDYYILSKDSAPYAPNEFWPIAICDTLEEAQAVALKNAQRDINWSSYSGIDYWTGRTEFGANIPCYTIKIVSYKSEVK